MYLFIFEDGEIKKFTEIALEDLDSVEGGVLDIIDITDSMNPLFYSGGGEWLPLESE